MRKIELLAPAKDAEIGKAAFQHGADAVYIGAPKFSARAAAGNEIKDIEALASYGHLFGAKTFVAFNTLFRDRELEEAEQMAWQLYEAGADALIVQDLGLLKLNLPPIELHASTQTDNRTADKVRLMRDLGMTRVVLARELNIEQIRAIYEAVPDVELECFVHGALCVSVSGQCYLSAAIANRSANRGVCAQPCRLPMSLINAKGHTVVSEKHLLSLKDMNRSALLEDLIGAGVTSLKIEGRLKDMSYVKNVTAFYRKRLDAILDGHPNWQHVSDGKVYFSFEPAVDKSFNRGFTEYQASRGLNSPETIWNFDTPKSIGEYIGKVRAVTRAFVTIEGKEVSNGDGLLIGNVGMRANKVEGMNVRPLEPNSLLAIKPGMDVWRNLNYHFERILEKPTAKRKVEVDVVLEHGADGYATMTISDGENVVAERRGPFDHSETLREDEFYEKMTCRFGETMFEVRSFRFQSPAGMQLFVGSVTMGEMRRLLVVQLMQKRAEISLRVRSNFNKPDYSSNAKQCDARGIIPIDFRANVLNHLAKEIMCDMKMEDVGDAFEKQRNIAGEVPVMLTRHCLKYALGNCPKYGQPAEDGIFVKRENWREPMCLKIGDRKFILKFGCKNLCNCEIFTIFAHS